MRIAWSDTRARDELFEEAARVGVRLVFQQAEPAHFPEPGGLINKEHAHAYGRSCAPLGGVGTSGGVGTAASGLAGGGGDVRSGGASAGLDDANEYVRAERRYVWGAMEAPPLRIVLRTLNDSAAGWFAHATESPSPAGYADCLHWCLPGVPDIWAATLAAKIATAVRRPGTKNERR